MNRRGGQVRRRVATPVLLSSCLSVVGCERAVTSALGEKPDPVGDPVGERVPSIVTADADASSNEFIGVVVPTETAVVRFRVPGRLSLVTEVGAVVKADQVVAALDVSRSDVRERERSAELASARWAVRAAKARRDAIAAELESLRAMGEHAARFDRDTAASALAEAEAELERARAIAASRGFARDEARLASEEYSARAPIDGLVLLRLHEVGAEIEANTTVLVIASERTASVRFAVPPTVGRTMMRGDRVLVRLASDGERRAVVRRVARLVDAASGSVFVEADFAVDAENGWSPVFREPAWVRREPRVTDPTP